MKHVLTPGVPKLMAGACALLLVSGCATVVPDEDLVEQRAMARWNALLSDDLAGAYEYLSPAFRSSVTSVQYQRSILLKRVNWTGAEFIESDCTDTICNVRISLDFAVYGALPGVKSFKGKEKIEESWVLVDHHWYLVPTQ